MPPEVARTPPPPLQVSSAVSRANGQRTYAFNGQRLPKHRQDLVVLPEHYLLQKRVYPVAKSLVLPPARSKRNGGFRYDCMIV